MNLYKTFFFYMKNLFLLIKNGNKKVFIIYESIITISLYILILISI